MVGTAADFAIGAEQVAELLQRVLGNAIHRRSERIWSCDFEGATCWISLLADAGPARREDGELPEQALELMLPLANLGLSKTLTARDAAGYLRAMGGLKYSRLARRAHPDGSGKLVLAALVTLYLAELDDDELRATVGELRTVGGGALRPLVSQA